MGYITPAPLRQASGYGRSSLLPLEDADLLLIHRSIGKIEACLKAKLFEEGRSFLAQLLFEFQPQITDDSSLMAKILSLLDQCDAPVLKRRLLLASGAAADGCFDQE
jgi:hypothetical protein